MAERTRKAPSQANADPRLEEAQKEIERQQLEPPEGALVMIRTARHAGASTFEYRDKNVSLRAIIACEEDVVEAVAFINLVIP